jgi:hypothetical protein
MCELVNLDLKSMPWDSEHYMLLTAMNKTRASYFQKTISPSAA